MERKENTSYDDRLCECGHRIQTHMYNPTGEMFGSVIGHCTWCKCPEWKPVTPEKPKE